MKVLTISDVRKNLAKVVDAAIDIGEETVISRKGGKAAIVIALDDYSSMKETLYLLSNAANRDHLLRSIAQLEVGQCEVRDLIDPETAGAQETA